MKVFVDANILLSAAYSPVNKCASLLLGGASKGLHMCTCDHAIAEALRNLNRKAPQGLERFPSLVRACTLVPTVTDGKVPPSLPPKDHPIWLSAVAAHCDVLLTGDRKDFGRLTHAKMVVMGPGKLFDVVFLDPKN